MPLFAELAPRRLGLVVLRRMLDGKEKPEEGQIFAKYLLSISHSARY